MNLPTVDKENKNLTFIITCLTLAIILIVCVDKLTQIRFSSDSWNYYLLSKSIFTDFYKVNVIRQFQFISDYSISFPPLYPVIIALFNKIINLKIYAGVVVNIFVTIATLFVSVKISKLLFKNSLFGFIFYLMIFLNSFYFRNGFYLDELIAARTIPLSILLTLIIFYIILKNQSFKTYHYIIFGLLAGLVSMTRFDFSAAGVVLGLALLIIDPKKSLGRCFLYYLCYFLVFSPWVLYSITHFSKPFISDNSRQVLLAIPSFITHYYPDDKLLTFIWNDPLLWIGNFIHRLTYSGYRFIISLVVFNFFIPLSILALIGFYIKKVNPLTIFSSEKETVKKFILFFLVLLVMVFCIFATGYGDFRYFLQINNIIILFLMFVNYKIWMKDISIEFFQKIVVAVFSIILIIVVTVFLKNFSLKTFVATINYNSAIHDDNNKDNKVALELKKLKSKPLILFDQFGELDTAHLCRIGTLADIRLSRIPENINKCSLKSLISNYKIDYVYTQNPNLVDFISNNYINEKIYDNNDFYIYRLIKLKPDIVVEHSCSIKRDPVFFDKTKKEPLF